ncbi:MAG: hypothetical protein KBC33_02825 [Candidatus Pacebacteria bacterium]|nr:hypothetical protein [Candidatus Paceibacterota bacterium]
MVPNKKNIIIVAHDGGELANQIWNHISVFAYACDRGYGCINHSFFEHARSFDNLSEGSLISRIFSLPYYRSRLRKTSLFIRLWRKFYKLSVVKPVLWLGGDKVVYSNDEGEVYYLPPTAPAAEKLSVHEASMGDFYFASVSGGVFRNATGIELHRVRVVESMRPAAHIRAKVDSIISPLRSMYAEIVAVHVRQTDYKTFKGGKYYVAPERAAEIMREYLNVMGKKVADVCFVVTTDESISETVFKGLNVIISRNDVVTDLFTLASCDALIGSDSTLGHFASYYGDIPHIIMKNEDMDWSYYRDKERYFVNKYLTVMRY